MKTKSWVINSKAESNQQVQSYRMKAINNANKELDKIEEVIKSLEQANK